MVAATNKAGLESFIKSLLQKHDTEIPLVAICSFIMPIIGPDYFHSDWTPRLSRH